MESANDTNNKPEQENHQQSQNNSPKNEESSLPAYVKTVKKKELDHLLKCPICDGFFRDAHTINECLCSFCKSCIYKYFYEDAKRETCPKCGAKLGGKPLKFVISDTSLQKIVDLLYPQFKLQD